MDNLVFNSNMYATNLNLQSQVVLPVANTFPRPARTDNTPPPCSPSSRHSHGQADKSDTRHEPYSFWKPALNHLLPLTSHHIPLILLCKRTNLFTSVINRLRMLKCIKNSLDIRIGPFSRFTTRNNQRSAPPVNLPKGVRNRDDWHHSRCTRFQHSHSKPFGKPNWVTWV